MAFFVTQRLYNFSRLRGVVKTLAARRTMTPQERANLYVSRMPIAVVTASLGGHPSDSAGNRR